MFQVDKLRHLARFQVTNFRTVPNLRFHSLRSLKSKSWKVKMSQLGMGYVSLLLGRVPRVLFGSLAITCFDFLVKLRFYVEWNLVKLAKEFEDLPRICRPTSDKFLFLMDFSILSSKRKIPHFVFQSINFFPRSLFDKFLEFARIFVRFWFWMLCC